MKVNRDALGWWLVAAQFVLIAILVWLSLRAPFPAAGWALLAAVLVLDGLTLFVLTIAYNRVGNWDVHPQPRAGGKLITTGPYRLIRHPMYAAVMLVAIGAALWAFNWWALVTTVALLAVLTGKIRVEETLLERTHHEWPSYAAHNWRLLPWIW